MYKDLTKQREAVRVATQRWRARNKGITKLIQKESVIPVIPKGDGVAPKVQHFNPMAAGYTPLPK